MAEVRQDCGTRSQHYGQIQHYRKQWLLHKVHKLRAGAVNSSSGGQREKREENDGHVLAGERGGIRRALPTMQREKGSRWGEVIAPVSRPPNDASNINSSGNGQALSNQRTGWPKGVIKEMSDEHGREAPSGRESERQPKVSLDVWDGKPRSARSRDRKKWKRGQVRDGRHVPGVVSEAANMEGGNGGETTSVKEGVLTAGARSFDQEEMEWVGGDQTKDEALKERIMTLVRGVQLWGATYVPPIEPVRRREMIHDWSGSRSRSSSSRKADQENGRILYVISSFDRGMRPGKEYRGVDKLDFMLMMADEMREACEVRRRVINRHEQGILGV